MKSFKLIFLGLILIVSSCQPWSLFGDQMSADDEFALAEMIQAIEMTEAYNDTLQMYDGGTLSYSQNDWDYCEGQFHYYDSLFNHYNDQYSHMNEGDDHEHDGLGGMNDRMHNDRNLNHGEVHTRDHHEQMDFNRTTHLQFH